jgi:subtilisin family serine protease
MASPHVAGLVALLYQAASLSGRKLSIQDVRTILSKAARANPPSSGHWDPRYGTGRVDAVAAIKLAMQVSAPPYSQTSASKVPSPLAMAQNGNGVFVDVLDAVGRAASRTNSVLRVQIEAEPAKAYDK